jgi:ribosomal protein S18 acetylase RimI-like enzyme
MHLRPYSGPEDLATMTAVVRSVIAGSPELAEVHPGDLAWWFGYHPHSDALGADCLLAEDGGAVGGWTVIDQRERIIDMAVLPAWRNGPLEAELLEAAAAALVSRLGPGPVGVQVRSDDAARHELLSGLGFAFVAPRLQMFRCPLTEEVRVPPAPDGLRILDAVDDEWVAARAECHFRAFDPSAMTAEAYVRFRDVAGYDPGLDVAIASEDGRVVAFCMVWVDEATQTSLFEPVGTRPAFWRQGLGRLANLEGLRRAQQRGVRVAWVNTGATSAGNVAFYESCGFRREATVDTWVRAG